MNDKCGEEINRKVHHPDDLRAENILEDHFCSLFTQDIPKLFAQKNYKFMDTLRVSQ